MRNIRTVSLYPFQNQTKANTNSHMMVCMYVITTTTEKDPVLERSERDRLWEKLSFTFLIGEEKWVLIFTSNNAQVTGFRAYQCSAIRSRVFRIRNIRIF